MQKDTKQTNILPSNQRPNLSNQNSNLPSYNYDSHAYGTQTVPTKRLIENKVYTYGLVSRKEYIRRKQNKTQYTENLGGYRYPKSIISGGPKKFAKFVSKKTSEDLRPSRVYVSQKNKGSKKIHYKINKKEGQIKKYKLIKTININMNNNEEDDNSSRANIVKADRIIANFPISKSWVKPDSSYNQKIIEKKGNDKYLNVLSKNKEKFHNQDCNNNENKNENYYKTIEDKENKRINSKELDDKETINSKNIDGCYSKQSINISKFKFSANEEKKDMNKIVMYKPEKIKTINDNKKEIMNLIILHDGNFCTSSWDSSIKIFNSVTYELLLKINEPKNNDVCYVTQLNDDSIILCSNCIFKYKLSEDDKNFCLETVLSGYNDYIIKVIELNDNSLVTCDWEYKIKVWKRIKSNDNNIQYELINSNINEGEHLSSLCKLNNNEFVSSSNSHLEKGNDVLRFYDNNYNNYKTIYNISCSELVDTICQIDEQYLCVALQKWNSNQVKGIAIVNLIKKQIVNTIQSDSMTCVSLINSSDKVIITGGRDKTNKKSIIRQWKLKNSGDLLQIYEVCTEQNDAITSIAKLNDGRILASNYDSTIVVLK